MTGATMPSMKLHPRTLLVQQATAEIRAELLKMQDRYELTCAEMLWVLTEHQQFLSIALLQEERHPDDPDRKADEA